MSLRHKMMMMRRGRIIRRIVHCTTWRVIYLVKDFIIKRRQICDVTSSKYISPNHVKGSITLPVLTQRSGLWSIDRAKSQFYMCSSAMQFCPIESQFTLNVYYFTSIVRNNIAPFIICIVNKTSTKIIYVPFGTL